MPKKRIPMDEAEKKLIDAGTSISSVDSSDILSINDSSTKSTNNQVKKSNTGRTNVFATVVYPDSAPADWMDILRDTHIRTLISPLHDKDKNPDGTQKKPHYHVMVMFDTKKNFDTQVKPIFDRIHAVGREEVLSTRGYARYLCHKDNPEKYQYDESEVTAMNGACYRTMIELPIDDLAIVEEIIDYIEEHDIYSFRELTLWCKASRKDWFRVLSTSRTYIIKEYLKSRYWDLENEDKVEALRLVRQQNAMMQEEARKDGR